MFKRFGLFLCGVCTIAALTSCGGEDLGGGIGEFTTVNATATADTLRLESDLLTGNTCPATTGQFSTDTVTVNFASTSQFPTGGLNLLISGITVRYTPNPAASTSAPPALPSFTVNYSTGVAPGTPVPIPVPVMPESYKASLASQALPPCSGELFEYFVEIVFRVSEPGGNGSTRDVKANLNVAIADRN